MASMLDRLFRRTAPPLKCGRVLLVEPDRRYFEAWSLLRETSRQHLEPFEPAWAEDELSRGAYRRRLQRYAEERARGTGVAFFVLRASDRALVGGVTLSSIRRGVTQSAALGYWIGLPFVRQGYASDAVRGVLAYAFGKLDLNRVEAACMPSNRASMGVLERTGFHREGLALKYLRINGRLEDHYLLARLRDDLAIRRDERGQAVADSRAREIGGGLASAAARASDADPKGRAA
ncbi:MAG: GNAT family N-acetyltransferase [Proteobacteria bacterium]|nr:GNAT family N-acetyltransferase [Pseudomonadota bacterium]